MLKAYRLEIIDDINAKAEGIMVENHRCSLWSEDTERIYQLSSWSLPGFQIIMKTPH